MVESTASLGDGTGLQPNIGPRPVVKAIRERLHLTAQRLDPHWVRQADGIARVDTVYPSGRSRLPMLGSSGAALLIGMARILWAIPSNAGIPGGNVLEEGPDRSELRIVRLDRVRPCRLQIIQEGVRYFPSTIRGTDEFSPIQREEKRKSTAQNLA